MANPDNSEMIEAQSAEKKEFIRKSIEFWNPGKTQFWQDVGVDLVIDRRAGLLPLRHGRPPPDRRAPQRRHLQYRPPPSGAGRGAEPRHPALRHGQPSLPGARPHRARREAGQELRRRPALHDLWLGRRRSDRHRDQDRAPRQAEEEDRLDREGLSRPYRPRGRHRLGALLQAVPVRPAGRVLQRAVQRPQRHGRRAARARTSPPSSWRRSRRPTAFPCRCPAISPK